MPDRIPSRRRDRKAALSSQSKEGKIMNRNDLTHKLVKGLCLLTIAGLLILGNSQLVYAWTDGQFGTGQNSTNNYVDVAKDPSGNLYGVWHPQGDFIKIAKWNGSSWVDFKTLTAGDFPNVTSFSDGISMAADSSGNLHLTFECTNGSGTGSERVVCYAKYDWSSSSWTKKDKIVGYTDPKGWKNADDPVIGLDGSNHPHVAFKFTDTNTSKTFLRYSFHNGTSWSSPADLQILTPLTTQVMPASLSPTWP
jgi:hypothetical protein